MSDSCHLTLWSRGTSIFLYLHLPFFVAEENSTVCKCHVFLIYSPVDEHVGCFQDLTVVNGVAVNVAMHVLCHYLS